MGMPLKNSQLIIKRLRFLPREIKVDGEALQVDDRFLRFARNDKGKSLGMTKEREEKGVIPRRSQTDEGI